MECSSGPRTRRDIERYAWDRVLLETTPSKGHSERGPEDRGVDSRDSYFPYVGFQFEVIGVFDLNLDECIHVELFNESVDARRCSRFILGVKPWRI